MGLGLTEDFDDLKVHVNLNKCGIPYPNDVPDDFELMYLETPRPAGYFGTGRFRRSLADLASPGVLQRHLQRCRRSCIPGSCHS